MMYSALFLAATAAVASAQVTFDPTTGSFKCPADQPNGAFCAGNSLGTNIIIRCKNGVGQPGNCNDNLAGFPPVGVQPAQCWQSSETSGIAACAKNCIVQGSSGTYNGTFTLPNCTPSVSSSAAPTTTVVPTSSLNGTVTITSTGTETTVCTTNGITTTSTRTFTTTYCPPVTAPTTAPSVTYVPGGNGTNPTATPVGPTKTPVAPGASTTSGPALSNGAMANSGSGLAAIGLFVAYFL